MELFSVISNNPEIMGGLTVLIVAIETIIGKMPIKSNCTIDFVIAFIRGGLKESLKKNETPNVET